MEEGAESSVTTTPVEGGCEMEEMWQAATGLDEASEIRFSRVQSMTNRWSGLRRGCHGECRLRRSGGGTLILFCVRREAGGGHR
jgi:hypothetical protein